jgi:hypothetical protein
MLILLCLNNSLTTIADQLSKDFSCSRKAIFTDYERRKTWIPDVEAKEEYATLLQVRLDFLNREALSILTSIQENADVKNKLLKIGAINTALRVTDEQFKLAVERGWIERQSIEAIQDKPSMPFAGDPEIRRVLLERAEEQRKQKQLRDQKRAEDAAESNKAESDAGS